MAPLLSEAYRRLGRLEDEASTLSLELKLARPPRLAEVHRRLALLRQDVLGDPSGALELHISLSCARSFAFENGIASTRRSWPTTSLPIFVITAMRDAAAGTAAISIVESMTGRVPGTIAVTVSGNLPTALATSIPVESTRPWVNPARCEKKMFAPLTGCPEASRARARRRIESPAVTVRARGVTSMRATGEGGNTAVCPCCTCCADAAEAMATMITRLLQLTRVACMS